MVHPAEPSELHISLVPDSSTAGQVDVELRFSQPGAQVQRAPQRGKAWFDAPVLQRLRETVLKPAEHGRELRNALIVRPELGDFFRQCLASAGDSLRLLIEVDASARDLLDLRWETLYNLDDTDFIAVNANYPLSRFQSSTRWDTDYTLPSRDRLRALVAVANPADLSRPAGYALFDPATQTSVSLGAVDVPGEVERALSALASLGRENVTLLADYPGSQGRATYPQITAELQNAHDIVYLVCHGALLGETESGSRGPVLLLEKNDGGVDRASGEALAKFIANLRPEQRPGLMVLASCQSGGRGKVPAGAKAPGEQDEDQRSYDRGALGALGPRLVEAGLPAVVAMQDNIKMDTIRQFMPVFFQMLLTEAEGRVDRALATARNQAYAARRPDWWVPVLYMRLRGGQVFSPPTGKPPQPDEPETVFIPPGNFILGREPGPGVPAFETPQASVYLPAYRLGKYPVTNKQFARFVHQRNYPVADEWGWSGRNPPKGQEDYPVRGVTWDEALDYCQWLTGQTGRNYSLPTEAQWEKAARGGDARLYPWGEAWQAGRCNQGTAKTAPVKSCPSQNEYGLYDLVGNVLQWTTTLWGGRVQPPDPEYAYPWRDDGRDDVQANRQIRRVLRGSAFSDPPEACTCTVRCSFLPNDRGRSGKRHGFRVVINP